MSWEETVVVWVNGLAGRSAVLDWVMFQLADGRLWIVPVVGALGWWLWKERSRAAVAILALAAGIGVGDFIGSRLKVALARPRPCRVLESWHEIAGCGGAYSMPSNHMLNSVLAASFLQVLYPRSGFIMWPLVILNGLSRLFTAAHYPSDVLVGALMGGAIGSALGAAILSARRRSDATVRA